MNTITIITSAVTPANFAKISTGIKQFEVSKENLDTVDYIRYISTIDGKTLGIYNFGISGKFIVTNELGEAILESISGDPIDTLRKLYGEPPYVVYIARIGLRYSSIENAIELEKQ